MEELEKDFKGVYIREEIWQDRKLSPAEKIYLGLCEHFDYDEYKVKKIFHQVSNKTIIRMKKHLEELGYIKVVYDPKQAKELVLQNKNKGETCEWCGTKTNVIHYHHYPIPKKDGGTEIVKICPNCHCEYHSIINRSVKK